MNSLHKIFDRLQPDSGFVMEIEYPIVGMNDICKLHFNLLEQRFLIWHYVPYTSAPHAMVEHGWARFLVIHGMVMNAMQRKGRKPWSPFDDKKRIKVTLWRTLYPGTLKTFDEEDCLRRRELKSQRRFKCAR